MAAKSWTADELTEVFRSLGAEDPEGWASSQLKEGIPQLHRYAFLKALWERVDGRETDGWVAAARDGRNDLPDDAAAAALKRMRELGVSDEDVTSVVRAARAEQVFFVAHTIDDPMLALAGLGVDPEEAGIQWGLFALDEDGKPGVAVGGLHESACEVGNRE